jgi:hypothetical protein
MLIDERILADGRHASVWARVEDGVLVIADDHGPGGRLPIAALDRVMVRFGRALDPEISPAHGALDGEGSSLTGRRAEWRGGSIDCGEGRVLRKLRFHAVVDTEARDYLVWDRPGQEPLAVIATMATAALRHLLAAGSRQEAGSGG